ncbi:DUF6544 family protein [Leptospira bouyouniensis]|uniref:DUF6544 family protein n=1 Tax=Leptospira bouyouniensis TaxID=2484911 RepID=UPI001091147B|nr:hypothetical protein EHQ99_19015 [Leptospira bouyouniensis]
MKFRIYILLILILSSLMILSIHDSIVDIIEWNRLKKFQNFKNVKFKLSMVSELPEPARRFFKFSIKEGTPLLTVAEIEMSGKFSLGTKEKPNYKEMKASQILASPEGFIWTLHLPGLIPISGSDTAKWTRFRILHLFPVARMGNDLDHTKSAFGRYVAESVFWTPAAVLPNDHIKWKQIDHDTVRVTIKKDGLFQDVDIKVNEEGCPIEVTFLRWSNANVNKQFQLQPFGGKLSNFKEVQGFKIPFHVEAANLYGTKDEFFFFKADINKIQFLNH